MAELIFAATGPLHWLKQFENQLEAQAWGMPYLLPNGIQGQQVGTGLLEPINLYRMIVPKEAMPLFQRTLMRGKGKPEGVKNFPIFALRKALGLQGLPEDELKSDWKEGPVLPVTVDHVQIVPIGYKEDNEGLLITGVKQEHL